MAIRPTEDPQWATQTIQEVVDIGGQQILVVNKTEPPQAFKNTGILAREKVGRARFNWILDLLCRFVKHLDERYAINDVHISTVNVNTTDLSVRLGGTWVSIGSQVVSGTTLYYFRKSA